VNRRTALRRRWPLLGKWYPMKMCVLFATAALALAAAAAAADDKDPIEAGMDACLESPDGASTVGMVECMGTAYAAWDKELNAVYGRLVEALDRDSAAALKAAQRQWIAFRDADAAFQIAPWSADKGTLVQPAFGLARVELVSARVKALRSYDATLDE